jgi:hypothetical protein
MKAHGIQRQPAHGSRKEMAFGAAVQELQHNNGMHPTGNSMDVIRSLNAALNASRRVMPGVMSPLHIESTKIPAAPQLNESELAWIIERVVE